MQGNERRMQHRRRGSFLALFLVLGVPGHLNAFASETTGAWNQGTKAKEPVMVIIGASYAKDWDIRSLGDFRVVNKGAGGEQTHQMRARFTQDVIAHRPSAVLIWGFINDIFRSPRENVPAKLAQTRENLEAMINLANSAGIRPILATEVFITSPDQISEKLFAWFGKLRGKQGYQDFVNANVRTVNIWIRAFAKERKITVLDFELALADENGERQRRFATEDGSHLSAEAYAALTEYTTGILEKQFPITAPNVKK